MENKDLKTIINGLSKSELIEIIGKKSNKVKKMDKDELKEIANKMLEAIYNNNKSFSKKTLKAIQKQDVEELLISAKKETLEIINEKIEVEEDKLDILDEKKETATNVVKTSSDNLDDITAELSELKDSKKIAVKKAEINAATNRLKDKNKELKSASTKVMNKERVLNKLIEDRKILKKPTYKLNKNQIGRKAIAWIVAGTVAVSVGGTILVSSLINRRPKTIDVNPDNMAIEEPVASPTPVPTSTTTPAPTSTTTPAPTSTTTPAPTSTVEVVEKTLAEKLEERAVAFLASTDVNYKTENIINVASYFEGILTTEDQLMLAFVTMNEIISANGQLKNAGDMGLLIDKDHPYAQEKIREAQKIHREAMTADKTRTIEIAVDYQKEKLLDGDALQDMTEYEESFYWLTEAGALSLTSQHGIEFVTLVDTDGVEKEYLISSINIPKDGLIYNLSQDVSGVYIRELERINECELTTEDQKTLSYTE